MNEQELNRFLHEKVMKECWHWENGTYGRDYAHYICKSCNKPYNPNIMPSYTTNPADYWRLLQKIMEDRLQFRNFLNWLYWEILEQPDKNDINPDWVRVNMFEILLKDIFKGCQVIAEFSKRV